MRAIHGGFGAFIPAGIRIGLDALERLKAEPRGVTVTFYSGEKSPCPCIADGVMLATQASPGQGTLQVAAEKAPDGLLAVVVVRDRKSGASVRYTIADEWMARIADWNKTLDPAGRYHAVMAAPGLFQVAPVRNAMTRRPSRQGKEGCGRKATSLRITRSSGISQLASSLDLVTIAVPNSWAFPPLTFNPAPRGVFLDRLALAWVPAGFEGPSGNYPGSRASVGALAYQGGTGHGSGVDRRRRGAGAGSRRGYHPGYGSRDADGRDGGAGPGRGGERADIDLLFTDIGLQQDLEAGLQLAKDIRQRPKLPVLYTTGQGVTDGMRAMFVEPFGLLPKPYTPDDLRKALGVLLADATT